MFKKIIFNILKNTIKSWLYFKSFFIKQLPYQSKKIYELTHSCLISDDDNYIIDITNIIKNYKVDITTSKDFYHYILKCNISNDLYESILIYKNVNLHIYFNDDIELKYKL
jgi:hypothetical protein